MRPWRKELWGLAVVVFLFILYSAMAMFQDSDGTGDTRDGTCYSMSGAEPC